MAQLRGLTGGMRVLLVVAAVLVALAGVQLFVFADRTEHWFAWTVQPPLTAAFLGSAYWSSAAVELVSARSRSWAGARVAVPGVLTFSTLTLLVTLVHLDRFHLAATNPAATRAVTWAWIAVYAAVPVLMAVLWGRQESVAGADPPRTAPLPTWLAVAVAGVASVLLAYGTWLLLAPEQAAAWWAWDLTPLTGRATGAWLVGLGVVAAQVVWEGDAVRARPAAVGAVVLPVLVAVALLRFGGDADLASPAGAGFVAALVLWAALGAVLLVQAARSTR